jgi:hypothetical protein
MDTRQQHSSHSRQNRPLSPSQLSSYFPIKSERRLLTTVWRRFEDQLQSLQYPAQELVCQIIAEYELGTELTNGKHSLKKQREELKGQISRLQKLRNSLPRVQSIREACEDIRSAHRPPGKPGSVREVMRLVACADYVSNQKEYYAKAGVADPAADLEPLADALAQACDCLDREMGSSQAKLAEARSIHKTHPHVGWRSGGIYYLLERIYREGSVKPTTKAHAHRSICALMGKLNCSLCFDEDKQCSSAIDNAIKRMPPQYKTFCDEYLKTWLTLPLKQH